MKLLIVDSVSDKETRLVVTFKRSELFMTYYPKILIELGIDEDPLYFPGTYKEADQNIYSYEGNGYDLEIIFFKDRVSVVARSKSKKKIQELKKVLFKYGDF